MVLFLRHAVFLRSVPVAGRTFDIAGTQDWINGFRIAGFLWACGCGVFLVHDMIRFLLANRAIRQYQICGNERLNRIYSECAAATARKKIPILYCGTLEHPICVTGVLRPVIIMHVPLSVRA